MKHPVEARRITPADGHYFFGYYGRQAFSADDRLHLALQVPFADRPNVAGDPAVIGMIDLCEDDQWTPLDDAVAWNWQMGTNEQWLGTVSQHEIIYNVHRDSDVVARIRDVTAGNVRDLSRAVYDVSRSGRWGVSLNFGRLHAYRPGYGYPGVNDPGAGEEASEDDGLYRIDLETGASRLIVSLAQCRQFEPDPTMDATPHWFNHAMVSPGGTRIMFLHRWRAEPNWHTRLFTCDPDGGNLCLLNPGPGISHCDWRDETVIVSWCQYGSDDLHYYLLTDRTQDASILGEALFCSDGHCCFCPDAGKRWLVTDTYPDAERMQTLILYDMCSNTRHDIGRYRVPPAVPVDIRCDLHPRWGRQETLLSFDGFHEPYRGVYVSHVPQLTGHSTESPGE